MNYDGNGVFVEGPNVLYCASIAARISLADLPSPVIRITSCVMSTQMPQPAA